MCKGLGTSTSQDAKKYFSDLKTHVIDFQAINDEDKKLVDLAFNKKRTDDRKEWLRNYVPGTHLDHFTNSISYGDFINKELILFSMADNIRSIPNVLDGLKPGQRKVMFACFKRKLKTEIKVAQLSGYVSEHSAYHHGEQSLTSTIVGLAQDFVGSNNLNLLEPLGQFGTRSQGGKDAASARYIFTSLTPFARILYNPNDDPLLNYLNEDGQSIEPQWYLPTLPMVLINGSEGIGTGWSSFVPNYNPQDIVSNLRLLLQGQPMEKMKPWYRGFTGLIEEVGTDRFKISGRIRKIDDYTIEITELPIRVWTQSYKEMLELWLIGSDKVRPFIKDYKEYHTDTTVHFIIVTLESLIEMDLDDLEKKFKSTSQLSTTNMVCFDPDGRIKKYSSAEEILQEFYDLRIRYYQKRKEYLTNQLTIEWTKLDMKMKFILEIIEGTLKVQNRKKKDIIVDLKAKNYTPFPKTASDGDGEVSEGNSDYDYLLTMPIYNLTYEKVQFLLNQKKDKEDELNHLLGLSSTDLWNSDLDQFLIQWDQDLTSLSNHREKELTEVKKKMNPSVIKKMAQKSAKQAKSDIKSKSNPNENKKLKTVKKATSVKGKKSTSNSKEGTSPIMKSKEDSPMMVDETPKIVKRKNFTISSDEDLDLPLSVRISRMMEQKANIPSTSIGTNKPNSGETKKTVTKKVNHKNDDNAVKKKKIIDDELDYDLLLDSSLPPQPRQATNRRAATIAKSTLSKAYVDLSSDSPDQVSDDDFIDD